jgi:hypothetical protein
LPARLPAPACLCWLAFIPSGIEIDPQGARKRFFLEKEAKTFAYWRARWIDRAPKGSKFFGSFFQKRTASPYLASVRLNADWYHSAARCAAA